MFANDNASKGLGMRIVEVGPGQATIEMRVRPDMLNGHAICHGGLHGHAGRFPPSAFACNSYNELTVASGFAIDFIAPAREGDLLTARCFEVSKAGRTGVYDTEITNQRGERVAISAAAPTPPRAAPPSRPEPNAKEPRTPSCQHPAPPPAISNRFETASRDEITALQVQRLRDTLQRAYDNVPHYRQAFDAKACSRAISRRSPTSRNFPFTVKSDLRDNYPFGMFAVPRQQVARIHASSGTTGKPTVVGYTKKDIDTWADLVARSIRAAGGRAGDLIHIAYGYGLFTGGLGAHYGAERAGCTVVPMSGGQTEKQVQLNPGLPARHHHGHAELHAGDHRAVRAPGPGRQGQLAAHRHLRRRAPGPRPCAATSRPRAASTRSTSTA
jgi:phenylacetic acid degradation protein PaaD